MDYCHDRRIILLESEPEITDTVWPKKKLTFHIWPGLGANEMACVIGFICWGGEPVAPIRPAQLRRIELHVHEETQLLSLSRHSAECRVPDLSAPLSFGFDESYQCSRPD
ncbi:hypothetical protein [Duganella sp. LjRoot269]|uniref:hypothetical protein n=1 Tax=Duganella sp. LjRoot269 TaxID=3342305 RepID=UPI003ED0AABF